MTRILLLYKTESPSADDPYLTLLPIGLPYLHATLLGHGYRSQLANLSAMNWRDIATLLSSERPSVVGISQFTHNRFESIRLADLAKKLDPSTFVVMGGPHATARYREILQTYPSVDAVVLGEGEATLLEMVERLARQGGAGLTDIPGLAIRSGNDVSTPHPRPPIFDLDTLPTPSDSLVNAIGLDGHRQLEFITTARGCPAACTFCSSPGFWGRNLRFRSPRAIVDEIRHIRDKFGIIYFSLRDDTFTANRQSVMDFCKLLVDERLYVVWNCQSRVANVDEELLVWMKRAGCECIQFGVESGSADILATLGKKITVEQVKLAAAATRKVGINLSIYLIAGVPGETEADIKATLGLIEDIRANDGQVSPLAYYPGTPLFAKDAATGRICKDIFEVDHAPALYLRDDDKVGKTIKRYLAKISRTALASRLSTADIEEQRRLVGYCHVTNIIAGEQCESENDWVRAKSFYREIARREPDNPWGWLLLGELAAQLGDVREATEAFERLARILPSHLPAYESLAELARQMGKDGDVERYLLAARRVNPFVDSNGLIKSRK